MIVTFQNINDETITSKQANLLDEYTKVYSNNGLVKKEEEYFDQSLGYITYYLDSNENETDTASQFSSLGVKFSIITKVATGTFSLENVNEYSGNVIIFKSRYLYDQDNSEIGEEHIDIVTNSPQYEQTEKYYYDFTMEDFFPMFTAYYNADGSLDYIAYDSYRFDGQDEIVFSIDGTPGINDIPTLKEYLGLSDTQMNYYLTASLDTTPS